MTKKITIFVLACIIAGTTYYSWDNWKYFLFPPIPCKQVIIYSIGSFDQRFGIDQKRLRDAAEEAEKVWENAVGKDLFSYDIEARGDSVKSLKINLIYDYRQETTKNLGSIETSIAKYKEKYDKLKKEYDALIAKSLLNDANKKARELNELADKMNVKVDAFNEIGESAGDEFNEGEYILDEKGSRINIYQFGNPAELRRLLEHEMGHALGLGHVDDPDAVMYRLNSSANEKLTMDDLQELRSVCDRFMVSK